MTCLLVLLYISISIGICVAAQWLVRHQGNTENRIAEDEHPTASFTTDVLADVFFATVIAAAMTAYSNALPSDSFFSKSFVLAYASLILPLLFVFLFDWFLPDQSWARLLKKKFIYRTLLLVSTFLAILSITFAIH